MLYFLTTEKPKGKDKMNKGRQSTPSSTTLPLISILILAFLSFAFGDHSAQPCTDDFAQLAEQKKMSYCKKLRTLEVEFGWNYQNSTKNGTLIEILLRAKLKTAVGWIAWGVNPGKKPQMIGTKSIIAIKHEDGTLTVNTYDVTKETKTGCRLMPSRDIGLKVLNMSAWSYDKPSFFTILSAKLILPSEYNITKLNHVWQVGNAAQDDQPLQHRTTLQNVDSTETIDLTSDTGRSTGQYRSFLRSVHGVLNIIGWGTLLPTGIIIARYFRVYPFSWDPTWFYLHVGFQLSGFLIGTAGWAIGLSLGASSKYYTFHTHRTFGILIFTFSTIQMLAFRLKPKTTDDYRKYWNMYHHFLGYGLLTIIVINIFKGISILKGGCGWKWTYIGILALLGAITVVFEIVTWVLFMIKPNQPIKIPQKPQDEKNNQPTTQKESKK